RRRSGEARGSDRRNPRQRSHLRVECARITTQRAVLLDTRARRAGSTFRILLVSSARSRARPLPEPAEPAPAATVATTWAAFGAAVLVTAHDDLRDFANDIDAHGLPGLHVNLPLGFGTGNHFTPLG